MTGFIARIVAGLLLLAGLGVAHAQAPPAQTEPLRHEIRVWAARDVAPGPKIRLSINTRNVPVVEFAAYRIDPTRWLLQRDTQSPKRPQPLPPGRPALTWAASVVDKTRKPDPYAVDIFYSRQVNLPPLPPGVYLIAASGGGKDSWAVVNITNLAVVLKRAPRRVLAWVTDYAAGTPLAGSRVRLWDRDTQKFVANTTTGPDGVCVFAAAPRPNQVLLVERGPSPGNPKQGPDVAGLVVGNANPDNRLVAHLQTDRPIYRPGDTVNFRAILRRTQGRAYAPEANKPVNVEVRDARENVIERRDITTGAVGTLAGETSLPAACAPGAYSIVLTARDKQTAYFPFSVAEYRKPEFLVTVAPSRHRYLSGEAAAFTVKAAYYFGAPLPQAKVKYQIRRSPNPFRGIATDEDETARWYASGDGNLYERDTYTADPFIAEGEVYTDAHGQAQIPFKTRAGLPDSTYTVTCTTVDAQRRQVDATGETPVYAAARRIGVRTRVMASPLGGLVPIEIALTDQDDKPVGGSVALLLRHQVYDEKKGTYHTRDLTQTRVNVPKTGRATATVPAMAPGSLEVLATVVDPTGRKAQAALNVWVAGRRDVPSLTPTEDPAVSLKLDRRTYAPGDTAQVFATTNTPGRPTLLVVEGGDFFSWIVFPARPGKGDTLLTWKVPVGVAMSPNAHISATQWARPAQVISSNIILPVPDKTRHITVSVTPDKTAYRPGDKATYTIQTRDGLTGKPVAGAEVAFAVTDASIFALRPDTTADPYAQFWGLRQNLTETLTSAPEEVSGGAYQRNSPNGVAPVREKFLDTAFWSAHVITGADGTATATVEMPGNLTSWRASALAVTGDTKVGRMVSTVSVSRPVMLRLATPRQFVQGDSIEIIATVHNQTTRAHTFEVALDAAGLSVEGADAKGQAVASVVAAPKSETKYRFRVKVGDVPESRLARISGTLIATDPLLAGETTNDLSDAVRLSVPVVPRGFGEHITVGGTLAGNTLLSKPNAALTLDLPADRIEPATLTTVRVTSGVEGTARAMAGQIVRFPAYGVETAAAQLLLAATPGSPQPDRRTLRDALAYLSRAQSSEGGWGLWDGALADATTTAHVLQALEAVRQQPRVLPFGVPFPDGLYKRGVAGAHYLYNQTNLWEERTLLAAALAPDKKSQLEQSDNLDEVQTRGTNLSPYATLALADALGMGNRGKGNALVKGVLDTALVGPTTATIPEGSHPGWRASQAETTAQALVTLLHRGQAADLQGKLAHWLAHPTDGEDTRYYSVSEQAAIARALLLYQAARGGASSPANVDAGDLTLTVGGVAVAFNKRAAGTEDQPLTATVPTALLKTGANTLALHRLRGRGELFIEADATVYRPHTDEADRGLRVLRRWEAQNPWGTWQPLPPTGAVSPSAPVRVTVLAWPAGDDTDALRITEPLPSGFEVVDSDALSGGGREEVRDGAVIHYVRSEGATPVTFRYYLRAEAAGNLLALPATGEVIRRPSVRGNSSATALVVSEETAKP